MKQFIEHITTSLNLTTLKTLCSKTGLKVSGAKSALADRLCEVHASDVSGLLNLLNKAELQLICSNSTWEEEGELYCLEDKGSKATLNERIMEFGMDEFNDQAKPKTTKQARNHQATDTDVMSQNPASSATQSTEVKKLDLNTLESWLWGSANIMRGSIDSSDFKNYIFGLLFLKRFNDVFEERITKLMSEEGFSREEAEEEEEGNLFVPEGARWGKIIAKTEDIGEAIDEAFAAIEAQNPYLEKVLTSIQFGDKDKLSNDMLSRLLRHFNLYNLGNAFLESRDMLGDAYEYLIKMFADDAGKKGGEFYTPKEVVQLVVRILDPQPGHSVYDPTCGSGGMLVETAHHVSEMTGGQLIGGVPNVSLSGQEKNLGTWAIAKLNLYLHNITDAGILRGDTLVDPKHKDDKGSLEVFDRVIANPPFSAKAWWTPIEINRPKKVDKQGNEKEVPPNYKKELKDNHGRFQYGIPPRGYADLGFVQHMLASLKDNGRLGVILPHGVLFRGGEEGKIREGLLKGTVNNSGDKPGDRIEGIIGLPKALFYNTGIPACILVLNKQKPAVLKNKVIMMDASEDFSPGKNQNRLSQEDVEKIALAYEAAIETQEEIDKYLRVVTLQEIEANEFNLGISRYIDKSEPEEEVKVDEVVRELAKLEEEERKIDESLSNYFEELGLSRLIPAESK